MGEGVLMTWSTRPMAVRYCLPAATALDWLRLCCCSAAAQLQLQCDECGVSPARLCQSG
jgi:hypothetical protein